VSRKSAGNSALAADDALDESEFAKF
jgi:hypothetical protein